MNKKIFLVLFLAITRSIGGAKVFVQKSSELFQAIFQVKISEPFVFGYILHEKNKANFFRSDMQEYTPFNGLCIQKCTQFFLCDQFSAFSTWFFGCLSKAVGCAALIGFRPETRRIGKTKIIANYFRVIKVSEYSL